VKVTDYFKNSQGQTFVSYEILPPVKGKGMEEIFATLDPLMEFKPPFVDVTYHREDYIYSENESGYFEKVAIRKRPGTVGICASIMHRYGVDAVPHLICGGFSEDETENALIDLNFLNINNVLALRGDARHLEDKFIPEPGGHKFALDLVKQINEMNQGRYLDSNIHDGAKSDFCIGVAGYPEKHFEAPNLETDIKWLKKKIDAGADYIVTQMFFDNEKYFEFEAACRRAGIDVPIVPGLKPITKRYQLNTIPRKFFINFPEPLVKAMMKAKGSQIKEVGTEWCIQQSKELKERGVPCLHYYTMGDVDTTRKICEAVH